MQSSATRTPTPRLVFWLPPEEAARRFGVERELLTAAVRAGELAMRAKVAGGELVATLCSTDLIALYGEPLERPAGESPRRAAQAEPAPARADDAQQEALHGKLVDAEDRLRVLELDHARLEGRLETADRIERGLQRYSDKLEQRLVSTREDYEGRLADAELLRLNLARVVGRMESEMARLTARLEHHEGEGPARLSAGEPRAGARKAAPKKRRWFRRG